MTNEADVKSYPGINVRKDPNGNINISQHEIIDKILNSLGICYESKMHDTPANFILMENEDRNRRKQ